MKRLLLLAILLVHAVPAAARGFEPQDPVLQLQVIGPGGTAAGTCVLFHKEARDQHVVLYFVTVGRLFDPQAVGEWQTAALRIRVLDAASNPIETTGRSVKFPAGVEGVLDLAVFNIVVPATEMVPAVVAAEPPSAGELFTIKGYRSGELSLLTERVRFRSTSLVLGDRTPAEVQGLVGAPAMFDGRVFGLVSECGAGRVPVITLLTAARNFLSRAAPGWKP
jgi:hypothetical protein